MKLCHQSLIARKYLVTAHSSCSSHQTVPGSQIVRRHSKIRAHDQGKGKSGGKQEEGPSFFPFYFLVRAFFSSFCDYLGPWNRLSSHVNGGIRNDVRNASQIYNSKSLFFKEPLNLHYNEINCQKRLFYDFHQLSLSVLFIYYHHHHRCCCRHHRQTVEQLTVSRLQLARSWSLHTMSSSDKCLLGLIHFWAWLENDLCGLPGGLLQLAGGEELIQRVDVSEFILLRGQNVAKELELT